MILLRLYWEFFKAGLLAIGGGLATIPFLQDISSRTGWFSQEDLANMIAVGESTPGPIGLNIASYAGYFTGGPAGALAATLGIVSPSILVILWISGSLTRYKDNVWVRRLFRGLRPASAGLIAAAGFSLIRPAFGDPGKIGLGVILFLLIRKLPLHPVFIILLAAGTGVLFRM